ncbi:MAG: S41 family peptidase [Oscillospiraceae bacterium]|nr:S41 family peptidase [Oscillospiraceae bacterium]
MKHYNSILKKTLCILLVFGVCLSLTGCYIHSTITQPTQNSAVTPAETQDTAYKEKLDEIVSILDQYYVDGYSTDELGDYLAEAAIASTGDKWSYYISAEDYAAYQEGNANAYVGIGVTIQMTNEDDPGFSIVSVSHNSPAEAAGLQIGDMIVAVEGENAVQMGMTEAQHRVRGEEGTDITITILRDGEEFDVTITRQTIEIEVVVYELLENNVGYIKINNFDTHSSRDAIAAIEALMQQGADSLIFDLRFNPGGMKHELVALLDYLLPEGPLFRSVDYKGKEDVDYSDASYLDMPMAVLINDDSYSAAEFFAAALQEYEAGVIVGTQTCGKANYQQTFRLSDGSAIAISTGHYQTPHGVTLADVGVTPDVIVEVDDETYLNLYYEKIAHEDDEQLQAAIDALGK